MRNSTFCIYSNARFNFCNSILFFLLLLGYSQSTNAQYNESFNTPGLGILAPGCTGPDLSTCAITNLTGLDWTLGGDLSGIDDEGLSTKAGGFLHFEDVDELSCWISPTLNISASPNTEFTVTFTIPSGSSWETSTTVGSIDFADIEYSVDGGAFVALPNINGCPGSGHTISGSTCGGLTGPLTFTPSITGLNGSTLDIRVCVDLNAGTDDGHFEEIDIPTAGVTVGPPVVLTCPTIGAVSTTVPNVCLTDPFDITATGLATMDMASNNELILEFGSFTFRLLQLHLI